MARSLLGSLNAATSVPPQQTVDSMEKPRRTTDGEHLRVRSYSPSVISTSLVPADLTSSARAGNQADDGDEQRRSDDRPENGKARSPYVDGEELGKAEPSGDPQPHEGADETEHDRDEASAPRHAGDGLAQSAAHAGDDEEPDDVP